jgi:hypothetical protein
MNDAEFRLPKGARVSLRDIPDPTFYEGMAVLGNEGWITKHRHDRYGLPEVYVHWDTNHWTWNGAQDRWTYEDHFDKVEEVMAESEEPTRAEQIKAAAAQFGETIVSLLADNDTAPEEGYEPDEDEPEYLHDGLSEEEILAKRNEAIAKVAEELGTCDSFLVIAAQRVADERTERGQLAPMIMGFFHYQPDADLLVSAQASAFGARAHQEAVFHLIANMAGDDDEADD